MGPKDGKGPIRAKYDNHEKEILDPEEDFYLDLVVVMSEIDGGRDPNPEVARVVLSMHIPMHRTHGIPTRHDTASRQLSSTPGFELTDLCGDNSLARQRVLVSDSLNDEQWGEDLSTDVVRLGNSREDRECGRART